MRRLRAIKYLSALVILVFIVGAGLNAYGIVIADYLNCTPLAYDKNSKMIDVTKIKGKLPKIKSGSCPLTVKYIEFEDADIPYS